MRGSSTASVRETRENDARSPERQTWGVAEERRQQRPERTTSAHTLTTGARRARRTNHDGDAAGTLGQSARSSSSERRHRGAHTCRAREPQFKREPRDPRPEHARVFARARFALRHRGAGAQRAAAASSRRSPHSVELSARWTLSPMYTHSPAPAVRSQIGRSYRFCTCVMHAVTPEANANGKE